MSTAKKSTALGTVWTVPASEGSRVEINKPDTSTVVVVAGKDGADIVLDQPGDWTAGEHSTTAK